MFKFADKKRIGKACDACKFKRNFEFSTRGCAAIDSYGDWLHAVNENNCIASFSDFAPEKAECLKNCGWGGLFNPITRERVY